MDLNSPEKDVKTDGDSEIYTEGKAISADPTNDDELSDISDDDEDTYEIVTVDGVTGPQVSRNAELVMFTFMTSACGDFTALEDALVRDQHVPGTRSYRKRLKLLKEIQVSFEENARNLPGFCGKLRVNVLWTTKGHVGMASFMPLS